MSINNLYGMRTIAHKRTGDFADNMHQKKHKSSHDTSEQDREKTPLHLAAGACSLEHIKLLCEVTNITDINAQSYEGTPLHCAIWRTNRAAVTALINCGASLTIKAPNGKSPHQLARTLIPTSGNKKQAMLKIAKKIQQKIQQQAHADPHEECPMFYKL